MASISSPLNCSIDMMFAFDLDDALTLLHDPSRWISTTATPNSFVVSLPTVVADAALDVCSVCMQGFQEGEDGKQVPCGHVYHQGCIAEWSLHHNSCPLCRSKIFQD